MNSPTHAASSPTLASALPPDDAMREELHNEVHARPSARIRLPVLIVFVAVLNDGVSREQECEHLRRLPGQDSLTPEQMRGNFLRLRFDGYTLKWERHTEFTRYSIVQPLPEGTGLGTSDPVLLDALITPPGWLREIPGRTVAAIKMVMLQAELPDQSAQAQAALMGPAQHWFGGHTVVASQLGGGHSWALTDFHLRPSGFERMLVITPQDTSETRAGRISQRLFEIETYRLMALRGLPAVKALAPMLAQAEAQLAAITAQLENKSTSEQELLDQLISLAARVERATAENTYRFAATRAYDAVVTQRIAELREKPIPGTQTIGEFMQRRLSPAMATVVASAQRLASLSERVSRTSALLRTRVDIVTEAQNQELLAKLNRGQELQLQLQSTVEGLSIAAISYYVISLLLYIAKGAKAAGLPIQPEIAAGALVPPVLWVVWRTTRRIHARLNVPAKSA
ncbi:DUF3422 family protein [Hydrogenophaga sp.]|uniref:DUF3422 family protein n=1 Tax=Hydrogenophaga sp. TaxID=1904254 RepID=UPI00272FC149|nr:DUF3422 domain-containing protein [Hydrogenophaga sp.]MDP2018725.1 DUF3422 domain-containing protein [Hydrogenophaga sp.]MDP3167633.1 DUF3422 domain-containing protein [Hydrogenophaga sp.]MDP3812781.1 DUF3422 domain-containing protein [Hydrogenophaga sp.]